MTGRLLRRAYWTNASSIALAIGAMLRYPGGTPLDRASEGYSITRNFLSDLGMTVAYNGAPNRLGASLFIASLILLVIGAGSCMMTVIRLMSAMTAARRAARLAGALVLVACIAFTGVAMTPENRVMDLHVAFTLWGWRLVALLAAMMTLASVRAGALHRHGTIIWAGLTACLIAYVILLGWGPNLSTPYGLSFHVIAQKVATTVLIVGLIFVARDADTHLATT